MSAEKCLACDLIDGRVPLVGGRIWETAHWVVEHCVGPLGVGTLIVKPRRHVEHVWLLNESETAEMGPLLQQMSAMIDKILRPQQVYVCLWSHAGWRPGHIHFVLQPVWAEQRQRYPVQGPALQLQMFQENEKPDPAAVERFADQARAFLAAERAAN